MGIVRASVVGLMLVVLGPGATGVMTASDTLTAAPDTLMTARLVPPAGYFAPAVVTGKSGDKCPAAPEPFVGDLILPSKYEGSDSARDKINPKALARYKVLTRDIGELEKGVNRQVASYLRTGNSQSVACVLDWLGRWADAGALLTREYTHTGKSMRKWALGSVSAAWLRLKFSISHPLKGHEDREKVIDGWIEAVANQVVLDWKDQPLSRLNNHQYWAAWSVMTASVATDRRDLFDWSVQQYRIAASQVDPEGYLPNELRRKTRALTYHNYSLPPLMMIAAFAKANDLDLRDEQQGAIRRLVARVEMGLKDPAIFELKTGHKQAMEDFQDNGKFVWLEPWCAVFGCPEQTEAWRRSIQPLRSSRLGGDLTQLFSTQASPAL